MLTALRAEEKACAEGVRVRWVLADVLAPPPLEPFDLVTIGAVITASAGNPPRRIPAAVQRLTNPGSQVLIQAGNANEERQYGPPRVKEEEASPADFSSGFEFQWLKTTRFDTGDPNAQGAFSAWSVLLRRK